MTVLPFEGVRVLVPVTERRRALAERLAEAGATVDEAQFIAIEGPSDPQALEAAVLAWCDGAYDWLAVTSRNAVLAMDAIARRHGRTLAEPQPRAQVATVGEATQDVCAQVGLTVSLVPEGRQTASGIAKDMPEGAGRALAPVGNLAAPTLERGIARRGWLVDAVEAYRTVDGPGASPETVTAVREGRVDAVLLTSGSVAERFASQCAPVPESTMMVAIGETTAAAARAAGLRVDAVSSVPSYDGIADALASAIAAKGDR
ncbi:uroporphyrinogen-III synthase [Demequina capsici]|uniref:Uroporphyrinogen-III synthase n=1 Tax=Demequina capsici TaxID=3075620 RepID=A0AA96JAF2_9MICO|nr:uroporphyrinogen-III synthase [Demequina sp. PMTSA13]WNM28317.1 uroporphyrinogen-III synthase [Demequina sp. PMTSA13]